MSCVVHPMSCHHMLGVQVCVCGVIDFITLQDRTPTGLSRLAEQERAIGWGHWRGSAEESVSQ